MKTKPESLTASDIEKLQLTLTGVRLLLCSIRPDKTVGISKEAIQSVKNMVDICLKDYFSEDTERLMAILTAEVDDPG